MAPYFVWQAQRPEPKYRHAVIRDYYSETEARVSSKAKPFSSYLGQKLIPGEESMQFFAGIALLPP